MQFLLIKEETHTSRLQREKTIPSLSHTGRFILPQTDDTPVDIGRYYGIVVLVPKYVQVPTPQDLTSSVVKTQRLEGTLRRRKDTSIAVISKMNTLEPTEF